MLFFSSGSSVFLSDLYMSGISPSGISVESYMFYYPKLKLVMINFNVSQFHEHIFTSSHS